jgi:hypothetical protein
MRRALGAMGDHRRARTGGAITDARPLRWARLGFVLLSVDALGVTRSSRTSCGWSGTVRVSPTCRTPLWDLICPGISGGC